MTFNVSFIIATLNEESRLPEALDCIKMQDYSGKVEVIIADGGSTDRTIEIAKKYGCKIFRDPSLQCEPRMHAAFKQARGEIGVFMSADNYLVGKDWLTKMLKPFENSQVQATTTHCVSYSNEHFLNRYFNTLPSDPLTFFIHGYHAGLTEMKRVYPIEKETPDYIIFKFNSRDYPIIGMQQGFTIRKSVETSESSEKDDILPIIEMIERNQQIAYVPNAGIRHVSITGIKDFFNKFRSRARSNLAQNVRFKKRLTHSPLHKKIRVMLAPFYFASFIWPAWDGVRRFIQTKDPLMLIHPFVCWLFLSAMLFGSMDHLISIVNKKI